jgi:hypothetical protein
MKAIRRQRLPPGLVRCDTCGECTGITCEKYLSQRPDIFDDPTYDPDRRVKALCRCHGPFCRICGVNRIPRPIAGHYNEQVNQILHVPHFAAARPCETCASRKQLEALRASQASLGPQDRAVQIPCEQRPRQSPSYNIDYLFGVEPGRMLCINAMLVMPTYASLISGVAGPESDAELILQARRRVRALWGERPTHVIPPEYQCEVDGKRTLLRMPPVEYCMWIESGPITDSTKQKSQLVVIMFSRRKEYADLPEFIKRSLISLPWDELAGVCE